MNEMMYSKGYEKLTPGMPDLPKYDHSLSLDMELQNQTPGSPLEILDPAIQEEVEQKMQRKQSSLFVLCSFLFRIFFIFFFVSWNSCLKVLFQFFKQVNVEIAKHSTPRDSTPHAIFIQESLWILHQLL